MSQNKFILLNLASEGQIVIRVKSILAFKTSNKHQTTTLQYQLGKKIKKVWVQESPQDILKRLDTNQYEVVPNQLSKARLSAPIVEKSPISISPTTPATPNITHKSFIFIDESGDLGWQLSPKEGQIGSSIYFSLAVVIFREKATKNKIDKFLNQLNTLFSRSTEKELKWSSLSDNQRDIVKVKLAEFVKANPNISLTTLTMKKTNKEMKKYQGQEELVYVDMLKKLFPTGCPNGNNILFFDTNTIIEKAKQDFNRLFKSQNANHQMHIHYADSKKNSVLQLSDLLAGLVTTKHKKGKRKKLDLVDEIRFSA
ncbi:MAG: DUF3800 domain-containing protein [Pelistega sp.]|nr:DUF3800 domain-containing protein [Pelistega sp.]